MSHRGEYRSIHTVLVDSPEFLDLSQEAQLIFFHLKLRLGPSGIGVLYPQMLEAVMPSESLSKGLAELQAGDEKAWLYVERNVFWIRNALRYEPSISLNHEKQRQGILNHLGSLPKLGICNRFADYYGLPVPFADLVPPEANPIPRAQTPSKGSPGPSEPPSLPLPSKEDERGMRESDTERDTDPENDGASLGDERMVGSEIVARWISFTGLSLSSADRGKQGAAAKRLAKTRSRAQIVAAMVGMTRLYPHSNGEPWDIFDLERKFAKAQAAASRHPELQAKRREDELSRALIVAPHSNGSAGGV